MAKRLGFENLEEMQKMISDVDISTQRKLIAFKNWQLNDGTKNGILKLSDLNKVDKDGRRGQDTQ